MKANRKTIPQLLKLSEKVNIADGLDQSELDKISAYVAKGFEDDEASRADWLKSNEEFIKLSMQVVEEKETAVGGTANVKYPLLLTSAIQFHARAYPAICSGKEMVKGKVTGFDPDGRKAAVADRISRHMSYQVNEEMEEWESDMDAALLVLPITGVFFKKTFYDPELTRNASKVIWGQDLTIAYKANFDRAPRKSELFSLYPSEIEEKKRSGIWLDVDLEMEDEENDEPEIFIEQHMRWDIDGDGYKEPYIVTQHKETRKIVRIKARYDESSIYFREGDTLVSVAERNKDIADINREVTRKNMEAMFIYQQTIAENGRAIQPVSIPEAQPFDFSRVSVARVDATEYYTRFIFLPSPDGGVYGMGLGQQTAALGGAVDTTINQMLDAASAANLQGGFMAQGAKTPAGIIRPKMGEYVKIDTMGMALRDSILPFNFPGPSAASFQLLNLLLDSGRQVTSVTDIMTGDTPQGETATTTMIKREEGMRVFTAIYKRIFRSLKSEFQKLYNLNAKYLPEESYFMVLDTPEAIKRTDYSLDKTNVQPAADPSTATTTQRILKAESLLPFKDDPMFDGYQIRKNYLETIEAPNIDIILPDPAKKQQGPDPIMMAQLEKLSSENAKLKAETDNIKADIGVKFGTLLEKIANAEAKEIGTQIDAYTARSAMIMGAASGETDEGNGQGMEGQPSDATGVPENSAGTEGASGIPGTGEQLGEQGQPTLGVNEDSGGGGEDSQLGLPD